MRFLKLFYRHFSSKTLFNLGIKSNFCGGIHNFNSRYEVQSQNTLKPYQSLSLRCCHDGSATQISETFGNFQEMMEFRRKQAHSTILIEIASQEDVMYAANLCEVYGKVKSMITYTGEHKELFLLTEYVEEASADAFLKMCQLKNIYDSFPVCSRLVQFDKKKKKRKEPIHVCDIQNVSTEMPLHRQQCASPSDMMMQIYQMEKLTDLNTRLRFLFSCLVEDSLRGMFPQCAALPFGSSVNSFGKEGCDLDVMLRLHPDKINNKSEFYFQTKTCVGDVRVLQQRAINSLYEILRTFFPGITYIQRILQARMPILKFRHKILNLECDISINNMTAVYMSEILYFCGHLDARVRPLVFTVKKWAKLANITCESAGSWITNFSLTLLVLYFLQNRPIPILPPLCKALDLSSCHDGLNSLKYLEETETWKSLAGKNTENLETLLVEFFEFLATFEFKKHCISLRTGRAAQVGSGYPLWIQYPLEEDMNVSKNVSSHELSELCDMARVTVDYIRLQSPSSYADGDLVAYLGIPILKKEQRIDVKSLYDNTNNNNNNTHRTKEKYRHIR